MKVRLEEKHHNKKRKFIKQDLIKYMINSFSTEEEKKLKTETTTTIKLIDCTQ
jgi:hypothetical protein